MGLRQTTRLGMMGAVLLIAALLLSVTLVWARTGQPSGGAPSTVPTTISFQGTVSSNSQPFSGTGHFKFTIVGASGSTAYWSNDGTGLTNAPFTPDSSVALSVTNGLFNVLLGDTTQAGMSQALSSGVFATPGRALRVWFDDGVNGFQQLSPDAPLSSVPFAFNAATLDGLDSSAFVRTNGLSNLVASAGYLTRTLADKLYAARASNVLVVAPAGGDFTSIQAALNSITNATALTPYLIEVAPGVYHESIVMKPYVDIQGSGEDITKITAPGSTVITGSSVAGASNAELRALTVENTGGQEFAIAVRNDVASPRLTNVTLAASGSPYAYGVLNEGGSPLMTHVTLTATGNYAYGVNDDRALVVIRDTTINVSGATNAYGVYDFVTLDGVPYTVTIKNSQIASSGGTIYAQFGYAIRVVGSQLVGGSPSGGGSIVCAGVYDGNYAFYASTCP